LPQAASDPPETRISLADLVVRANESASCGLVEEFDEQPLAEVVDGELGEDASRQAADNGSAVPGPFGPVRNQAAEEVEWADVAEAPAEQSEKHTRRSLTLAAQMNIAAI
jgi:hypothetical protein